MKSAIVYSKKLEGYGFGEGHPFGGDRFSAFFNFFNSRFAACKDRFEIIEARAADDESLELVHTKEYIDKIKRASKGEEVSDIFRFISIDNVNPVTGAVPLGIHEASKIIIGSAIMGGDLVMEGKYNKAIAFGGMHHAKSSFGEGFCFYNDIAILVRHLKQKYKMDRILVLDTDAHAGNGTKDIFYEDPSVLFIDIHQDPGTIYPGTGFVREKGEGKGEGFTVNIPVPPGTGDDAYKLAFDEIIHPLAAEFRPQIIIRYGGSDPHYLDPLTSLGVTVQGFKMIGNEVRLMADELTNGRCVDSIFSGYNLNVLPHCWSAIIAGLLNLDTDLTDLKETDHPPSGSKLSETKMLVKEIKTTFKKYWRCMGYTQRLK